MSTQYSAVFGGPLTEGDFLTEDDVNHQWVYCPDEFEEFMYPCSADQAGAFPVTTIWGLR